MERKTENNKSCIFTIFGATGDLTKRKLIPAVYTLYEQGRLPDGFTVIAVGRRDKTRDGYRDEMYGFMRDILKRDINDDSWRAFRNRIIYQKMNFLEESGYENLHALSKKIDKESNTAGNRIYYLATAPEFFELIIRKLHDNKMLGNKDSWQRVIIEKPFGTNLKTARELNNNISKMLEEDKIFRVDHYLGKEMIQNILSLRFGNSIFEPLWNNRYIDSIQIISTETLGVGNRGSYYDETGIAKDMLQNHILQMLSLIAMEPPINLSSEAIRDEKVKVLQALRPFTRESFKNDVVTGQYGKSNIFAAYRDEDRISDDSKTDTFIALKTCVDNFRWGGVPVYIFAGKRLSKNTTRIVIHFKKLPGINFYKEFKNTEPNVLVIRVQPEEGVFFRINAKHQGNDFFIGPVEMDYCQNCGYDSNSPEAYERLILEALNNNSALFTRWDELEYSWRFIDSLCHARKGEPLNYPNYEAGGTGPVNAYDLIEKDNRKWWDEGEDENDHI